MKIVNKGNAAAAMGVGMGGIGGLPPPHWNLKIDIFLINVW